MRYKAVLTERRLQWQFNVHSRQCSIAQLLTPRPYSKPYCSVLEGRFHTQLTLT